MTEPKREPAVVDGKLVYTSISAVNRHVDCERSWWFRYHERLPDDAGKAAQAGTESHARLTSFVNDGVDVLKPLEREGLVHIPRGPGVTGEASIEGALFWNGLKFKGGIDHLDLRSYKHPVVTDYKFKGQLDPFVQLTDPRTPEGRQMLAYARAALNVKFAPFAEHVTVRHLQFKTKGRVTPGSVIDIVAEPLPVDTVQKLWEEIGQQYVDPIHDTAAATKPEDVKANRNHCFKYHKACAFYDRCPKNAVSFGQLFGFAKEKDNVGLLDQFKKANAAPVVEHFPITPPVTVTPEAPAPINLQVVIGGIYTLPDGAESSLLEVLPGGIGRFVLTNNTQRDVSLAQVVFVPTRDPKVDTTPLPAVEKNAIAAKKPRAKKAKEPAPDATTYVISATPTADALMPFEHTNGIWLFVGCSPIGVKTSLLHEYTAKVEAEILKTLEETMPDIRLSSHEMLGFGRWKAVLKQSVLKSLPPAGSYIVPAVPGEILQVVTDALMGVADFVVLR